MVAENGFRRAPEGNISHPASANYNASGHLLLSPRWCVRMYRSSEDPQSSRQDRKAHPYIQPLDAQEEAFRLEEAQHHPYNTRRHNSPGHTAACEDV
jgi:hypothetical protein